MAIAFTLTGVFGFVRAAEPTKPSKEGEEWLVRTIQVPGDLVHTWEAAGAFDSKQLELKPLPPADAPEAQLIENIRNNTAAMLKHQWLAAGSFPQGTAFLLDPATCTLAVRTSQLGLEFLESLSQEFVSKQPCHLALRFELFQAEASTVRRLLQEGDGKADNTAQFNRLKELVAAGEAKNIGTLKLETRSGQRAVLESTHEHNVCSGVSVDDKGKLETSNETRQVGLKVEVDPVIGPDGDTVDINYALEYHFAPPVERREQAGEVAPLGKIMVPVADFHVAKITTATTSLSGMNRVLGVWKPFGTDELDGADLLQIAFLRTDVVRNLPVENKALAARLKTAVDKAMPIPRQQAEGAATKKGMITRSFRVPPDFFSSRNSPASTDGSEPDSFPSPKEGVAMRPKCRLPKEILGESGIPFPEGASASFYASTGLIVVTNTRKNLDTVEAFFAGLHHCPPILVAFTTHILQAEGSVMRQLLKETNGIADHAEVWKKAEQLVAQGEATVLSTQRLESRSGQRCTIEAVEEHRFVNSFAKDEKGRWNVGFEMRPVGARLEIDPVVGPDGYTLDLNLAPEYHHAPPMLPGVDASAPAGTYHVQSLLPVFHMSKLSTAITMGKGMTRLLGVWKPEGKPEFDDGDILQAVFIKADVVPMERATP
jgi:hypothetical protein